MNKTILITGATGLIGCHLVQALRKRSDEFVILTTNSLSASKVFPDSKKIVEWKDYLSLKDEKMDAVVNLAGINLAEKRWNDKFKQEVYDSRIESTKKIVSLIKEMNVKPEVLISSSGVDYYPDMGEKEAYEDSPPGTSFASRLTKDWEAEAMKAQCRVVCLRTGLVVAKESHAIKKMTTPFKFFVGAPISPGTQYMSWIHIDDMVNIILFAIDNENVKGPVNCAAPNPETNKNFSRLIAKILHRPCWFPVPQFVVWTLFGEAGELIFAGRKAVPKKIIDLGFKFKYVDAEEALRKELG